MIKNANDLLGFLIKNRNGKNEVRASVILENAGMDSISLNYLIKQLKEQCFIIYSYDTIGITDLGLRNYISPMRKSIVWVSKLLILTLKNLIVYAAGIASGVIIAYLSNMLIR